MSNNTLTLGRIDFGPLSRFTVGFDEMFEDLTRITNISQQDSNYPPYNIIKYSEESYAIELAVAGFDLADIDIDLEGHHLTISGTQPGRGSVDSTYVHRGISARGFNKTFTLGNHIEVSGASMKNGMLIVSLVRVLPENLKSRKISITSEQ